MSATAIIGMQWGDEGKGKMVDWLAADARHVARFQGGHNAGHTLVVGGKTTTLHLLPSGVLHPRNCCYIGTGVVVSPAALLGEIHLVGARTLAGRLFVSAAAALVLPYHAALDKAREAGQDSIGTTLRGIGPACEDKYARRAIRLYDLYNGQGEQKLARNIAHYRHALSHFNVLLDADNFWSDLCAQAEQLRPFVCDDIGGRLSAANGRDETILLEGAQGALLDIEQGTYPYTTSAPCLASASAAGLGAELSPAVVGVIKAYATRVGNGPFPTQLDCAVGAHIARAGQEFGSSTGRPRRCGWLDIPMVRHALRINGCRRLMVTKLDVLDEVAEIKICDSYTLDGATVDFPPPDPARLARCRPSYTVMPGWRGTKTAEMKNDSELPPAARKYLAKIEEMTGAEIEVISTGPDRESNIIRRHPFLR